MSKKQSKIEIVEPQAPKSANVQIEDDDNFLRALQYISMYEYGPTVLDDGTKITKQYIAEEIFKVDRSTLDRWVNAWGRAGLLRDIRRKYFLPNTVEDLRASVTTGLQRWRNIFERQLEIAENSKSDQFSLQAAQWIWQEMVKPTLDNAEDPGNEELEYVEAIRTAVLNPMAISEPSPEPPDEA